jgi:hypothetical protein
LWLGIVAVFVRQKHPFRHHCKHVKQKGQMPVDEGTKEKQLYLLIHHYRHFTPALELYIDSKIEMDSDAGVPISALRREESNTAT